MGIRLVFVGRCAAGEADRITTDYLRRIRRFCPVKVTEVRAATGKGLRGASRAERESRAALAAVGEEDVLIALDPGGAQMTSGEFALLLDRTLSAGSDVTFVVGGADGLTEELTRRADRRLALSKMTLPHELARALLAEQIYRALGIVRGTPYHR